MIKIQRRRPERRENEIQKSGIAEPKEIRVVQISGKRAYLFENLNHLPDNHRQENDNAESRAEHAFVEKEKRPDNLQQKLGDKQLSCGLPQR